MCFAGFSRLASRFSLCDLSEPRKTASVCSQSAFLFVLFLHLATKNGVQTHLHCQGRWRLLLITVCYFLVGGGSFQQTARCYLYEELHVQGLLHVQTYLTGTGGDAQDTVDSTKQRIRLIFWFLSPFRPLSASFPFLSL